MKRIFAFVFVLILSSLVNGQILFRSATVEVVNTLNMERCDAFVSVPVALIENEYDDFNEEGVLVFCGTEEIPSQLFNYRGSCEICFVSDFAPNETKTFTLKYSLYGKIDNRYPSRTYAEIAMKVDAEFNGKIFNGKKFEYMKKVEIPSFHIDHNAMFKYEGPGWESDKVGYRFYIDPRNSVDIFGKKTTEMVLDKVGAEDLIAVDEKYHEMNDWGTDIFKVGNSLGIGTIAMESQGEIKHVSDREKAVCEISANGPIKSEITTDYFGWKVDGKKYDLNSKISINAGSRLTEVDLFITNLPENISTGIAKHKDTRFFKSDFEKGWNYIALYGKQTVVNDNLGIVLFYRKSDLIEQFENDLSYVVKLFPREGKIKYYYAAAWEQEPGGVTNIVKFKDYINSVINELNNPLNVSVKQVENE